MAEKKKAKKSKRQRDRAKAAAVAAQETLAPMGTTSTETEAKSSKTKHTLQPACRRTLETSAATIRALTMPGKTTKLDLRSRIFDCHNSLKVPTSAMALQQEDKVKVPLQEVSNISKQVYPNQIIPQAQNQNPIPSITFSQGKNIFVPVQKEAAISQPKVWNNLTTQGKPQILKENLDPKGHPVQVQRPTTTQPIRRKTSTLAEGVRPGSKNRISEVIHFSRDAKAPTRKILIPVGRKHLVTANHSAQAATWRVDYSPSPDNRHTAQGHETNHRTQCELASASQPTRGTPLPVTINVFPAREWIFTSDAGSSNPLLIFTPSDPKLPPPIASFTLGLLQPPSNRRARVPSGEAMKINRVTFRVPWRLREEIDRIHLLRKEVERNEHDYYRSIGDFCFSACPETYRGTWFIPWGQTQDLEHMEWSFYYVRQRILMSWEGPDKRPPKRRSSTDDGLEQLAPLQKFVKYSWFDPIRITDLRLRRILEIASLEARIFCEDLLRRDMKRPLQKSSKNIVEGEKRCTPASESPIG